MTTILLDELKGRALGPSEWIEVPQHLIDDFGRITGDMQDIHTNPAAAANGPYGGAIAHGFLTMSLLSQMASGVIPNPSATTTNINYGFDRLRFVAPVRAGKRVRGHFMLTRLEVKGAGRWLATYDTRVEIEGEEKPALVADWMSLIVEG